MTGREAKHTLLVPGETYCGAGCTAEVLREVLGRFGTRVAVARGGMSYPASLVRDAAQALGVTLVELPPQCREPETEDVDAAVTLARDANVDAMLAVGGGSVLDLGKAVAALVAQDAPTRAREFLEGVGSGRLLTRDPLPFIAIPTTAGTGSEVTKNAVISSRRDGYKKSLRDPRMIADIVILDADLTCSLPPHLTAWSGLDAVTQLIETYTSRYAQPYTDALALRGLRHARALPETYRDGTKLSTRGAMLLAAHFSGLCLANAGLGAAHGIAAALCAHADIPHGLACAVSLPWVMAMNASVVGAQYVEAVAEFTGEQTDVAGAIDAIWRLLAELAIPRVTALPALEPLCANAALPALAAACHGNSLRGNPRALADEDLIHLLRAMRDTEHPRMLL